MNRDEFRERLKRGDRPTDGEIRAWAAADKPGEPNYVLYAVAAALVGDAAVLDRAVKHHLDSDYDAYLGQKAAGVSRDDLAYKPTIETSRHFFRQWMEGFLKKIPGDVALEIMAGLKPLL